MAITVSGFVIFVGSASASLSRANTNGCIEPGLPAFRVRALQGGQQNFIKAHGYLAPWSCHLADHALGPLNPVSFPKYPGRWQSALEFSASFSGVMSFTTGGFLAILNTLSPLNDFGLSGLAQ